MPTSRPGKLDDTARFMTDRRETAPSSLDRLFQITERGSTISREVRGGFVTFFTMAYIIVLNPLILGFAKDADGQYLGGGAAPDLAAIAAGTALVLVGFLMMQQVTDIDWKNIEIAIPAFLTIILMPFTYSITVGIGAGFVSYVFIKLVTGKTKDVHPLMWLVSLMFVAYFAIDSIKQLLGV